MDFEEGAVALVSLTNEDNVLGGVPFSPKQVIIEDHVVMTLDKMD